MIPDFHKLLLDRRQQQGGNTNEASALLRNLPKIMDSGIGIDTAVAKGKLLLDNQRETTHRSVKEDDKADA
jgi:hypothetical protein